MWLLAGAAFLILNALTARLDHDESQYVAGATLASRGLPVFRSFMSLQPPLQTWFYAPAALLFPDDSFVAMRLLTAMLALSGVVFTYYSQRILRISKTAALGTCALMMSCGPFVMASGVVRNDMLAFAASASGMLAALLALRSDDQRWGWSVVGLCFGLAASTKLSFAPYGFFCGIFLLCERTDGQVGRLVSYAGGALVGLAPVMFCATAAPSAFLWGVLTFGLTAPHDWYAFSGLHVRLTSLGKSIDLAVYALQGPLLLALLIVVTSIARNSYRPLRGYPLLLVLLLVGGIVGATLPTPAQKQYLVALMAPLFVLLGLVLSRMRVRPLATRMAWASLFLMAAVGVAKPVRAIIGLRNDDANALKVDDAASWIGKHLRSAGDAGDVVTLSADRLAGSGYFVDPRFATGPFLLRSGHLLTRREAKDFNVATVSTLNDMLDSAPPAGLLTGYEDHRRGPDLEGPLIRWALRRGYSPVAMPDGIGKLYVCPGRLVRGFGCLEHEG